MENILLKKSFHAKNFKLLKFNSLWGYKGIFTTIRLFGKEPNFILVDQHLKKLNKDLRYFGIDVKISKNFLTNFLNKYSKIKNYDHLLRIAVTKKIISLSLRKRNKDHKYFTAKFFRFQRALPNFKNLQYKKIISLQKKINLQKEEILFYFNNKMIKVWRTKIIHSKFDNIEPGKIIKLANLKPVIKCGKNSLKLINFSPKITKKGSSEPFYKNYRKHNLSNPIRELL